MIVLEWKERAFVKKVNSRCFCCFPAAISRVHQNGDTTLSLNSRPIHVSQCEMHSYIARFWREILCGNLRNTTSSLQQNEGTNNILFISIKGKKLISHNSSFICWFEVESTSLEETHKRRLPLYNKWWNREFTLEKEWIRFALASQGNNSCISFFMTKKALYVRFTLFGYVESLI